VIRPVVVYADRFPDCRAALRWAAAEAGRLRAPLHVLVTSADTSAEHRGALADTVAAVLAGLTDVPLVGRAGRGAPAEVLREVSADAQILVITTASPDLDRAVASSFCPVVAVPEVPGTGDGGEPGNGPVVLGAAPWTDEVVVGRAFAEAARRRARLVVVRAGAAGRSDHDGHEIDLALSMWKLVHPDVEVETMVLPDPRADVLLALTRDACLLVLGRSARGALLAGLVGSPVHDVLHAARCPVLVVPPPGPPRTTLLPQRTHGWALSNP
jgi:nucleotide-binding universal stress UspA family protein